MQLSSSQRCLVAVWLSALILTGCGAGGAASGSPAPATGQEGSAPQPDQNTPGGVAAGGTTAGGGPGGAGGEAAHHLKRIFIIVLENTDWSSVLGSASAPYMNKTLLAQGAHAEKYDNVANLHPSEPNYMWMIAGNNFGVTNDNAPSVNAQNSNANLAFQMDAAKVTWKAYQEGIDGAACPLSPTGAYVPRHDPFLFFTGLTGTNRTSDPYCIAHNRPYTELQRDLANNTVATYNFLTPDLCNDGHDACPPLNDQVAQMDAWLHTNIPLITASQAYKDDGAIFITWDESDTQTTGKPIGMIALSPLVKQGYTNASTTWNHSSLLRTAQDILHLTPYLGDAANATNLGDLFTSF